MIGAIERELLIGYAVAREGLLRGVRERGRQPGGDALLRHVERVEYLDAYDELFAFLRGHRQGGSLRYGESRHVEADSEGGLHWREWSRWPSAWRAYLPWAQG